MEINEECARKVIDFLLKDDVYNYRRWNSIIKQFNFEKIQNLLNGKRDENNSNIYDVSKKDIFDKLVQKFDNYSKILLKWYEKEDYYKYLKQLWLNYICIEEINDDKINNKPELITKYLESNKIPYSSWPNEVKEEFIEAVKETNFTYIHEQEFKDKFNKEHLLFDKIYSTLKYLMDSTGKILSNADKKSKDLFLQVKKEMNSSILPGIVSGVYSLIVPRLYHNATECVNYDCLEKFLVKQIYKYIPDITDAKAIAADVIKECKDKCGIIKWGIKRPWLNTLDQNDGSTVLENYCNYENKEFVLNLDGKESETISLAQKIQCIFQSQITCGLIAAASFINLCFSIKQFYDISKITEEISKSKDSYKIKLDEIKQSFESHLKEINLNLYDLNPYQISDRINYIKNNIEGDKNQLMNLLVDIKRDIAILEEKRTSSKKGVIISGIIGAISGIGAIIASGGVSAVYTISTISNLVSLSSHVKSAYDCYVLIDELIKIENDATKEINKIQEAIEQLDSMTKQIECSLPSFYQEYNKILEKQSINLKKNTLLKK